MESATVTGGMREQLIVGDPYQPDEPPRSNGRAHCLAMAATAVTALSLTYLTSLYVRCTEFPCGTLQNRDCKYICAPFSSTPIEHVPKDNWDHDNCSESNEYITCAITSGIVFAFLATFAVGGITYLAAKKMCT